MTHKRRTRIRSKGARMQFRKAECKSEVNGYFVMARLLECQAGQLIAFSVLVASIGATVVALPQSFQALLLWCVYRLMK